MAYVSPPGEFSKFFKNKYKCQGLTWGGGGGRWAEVVEFTDA